MDFFSPTFNDHRHWRTTLENNIGKYPPNNITSTLVESLFVSGEVQDWRLIVSCSTHYGSISWLLKTIHCCDWRFTQHCIFSLTECKVLIVSLYYTYSQWTAILALLVVSWRGLTRWVINSIKRAACWSLARSSNLWMQYCLMFLTFFYKRENERWKVLEGRYGCLREDYFNST